MAKDGSISLHFVYICRKEEGAHQKLAANFMHVVAEIRAEMDEEKSSDNSQNDDLNRQEMEQLIAQHNPAKLEESKAHH